MAVRNTAHILTKRGWKLYNEVVPGDETLGRANDGSLQWTEILKVRRRISRVRNLTAQQRTLDSTFDHPWFTIRGGRVHEFGITRTDALLPSDKLVIGGWYEVESGTMTPEVARAYGLLVAGRAKVQDRSGTLTILIPSTGQHTYLRRVLRDMETRVYNSSIQGQYTYIIAGSVAHAAAKLMKRTVSENVWDMDSYIREEFLDTVFPYEGDLDIGVRLAVYLHGETIRRGKRVPPIVSMYESVQSNEVDKESVFNPLTELGSWTMYQGGQIMLTGGYGEQ